MNDIQPQVEQLVQIELDSSNEKFPPFHSTHEGYSVILEEVCELRDEMGKLREALDGLWYCVRSNSDGTHDLKYLEIHAINAACEAIQVAAMCQKFRALTKEP